MIRVAILLALAAQVGWAQERTVLPHAISRRVNIAERLGRANGTETLPMSITLPLRHPDELAALIEAQHRPGDPAYRRWLSPAEFTARFAPAAEDYEALAQWLAAEGFIVRRSENRVRLTFSGSVDQAERTFAVRVDYYRDRGATHLANSDAPLVPAELAGEIAVLRLNTFPLADPLVRPAGMTLNTMAPRDLQLAYNVTPVLNRGFDGAGQIIAVVARSDYNSDDVVQFQQQFGGSALTPTKLFPQGTSPGVGASNGVCRAVQPYADRLKCIRQEKGEVLLDVQWANALAPGANVLVDIAGPALGVLADIDESLFDIVNHHPEAKVITMSFGACERLDTSDHALFAPAYAQAAAQGQTIFVASGDDGVNDCGDGLGASVNVLASDANVTAVGGTALDPGFDADGNATGYVTESVWNDQYGASGGGLSSIVPMPSYQSAIGLATGGFRSIPDVSLLASPSTAGYVSVMDGTVSIVGGTSAGAPSWAGIMALLNQIGAPNGAGVANYHLYAIGERQYAGGPAAPFHDITAGNNGAGGLGGFAATPGYDFPTGLGTPNVDVLSQTFAAAACSGDCDRDWSVTIDEILTAVNVALGAETLASCPPADVDGNGAVTVDELLRAVNHALNGC